MTGIAGSVILITMSGLPDSSTRVPGTRYEPGGVALREGSGQALVEEEPRAGDSPLVDEDDSLHCRLCGYHITSDAERISVHGSHDHAFLNPLGLLFHIGCFSGAPGCLDVGESTDEYTWFPGYSWCFALCARCRAHLGWRYRSGAHAFWGLILDRLERG